MRTRLGLNVCSFFSLFWTEFKFWSVAAVMTRVCLGGGLLSRCLCLLIMLVCRVASLDGVDSVLPNYYAGQNSNVRIRSFDGLVLLVRSRPTDILCLDLIFNFFFLFTAILLLFSELPHCPLCFERLDTSVTGVVPRIVRPTHSTDAWQVHFQS